MQLLLEKRSQALRPVVIPTIAFTVALGTAIAGAIVTGATTGSVNQEVDGLSSSASGFLGGISGLLPLGFAFGVGMVSAVNPCGFTMLPAYLGLYLGADSKQTDSEVLPQRLSRALLVGATVTAGFVMLFAVVGISIGSGAQFLVTSFPWIGLAIGVALVGAGAWLLHGGSLYSSLGERVAAHVGDPAKADLRGYFLFGLSYGTASLSCTLPIFLTVIGGSIAVSNLVNAMGQFILYGLGMGSVILALTLSMALFKSALTRVLRRATPYIQTASAVLLLVAGGYIVYYWLTQGELLKTFV